MADNGIKLFGFEINRSKKDQQAVNPIPAASVVAPTDDDGTGYVTSPSSHYGTHMDIYADLQFKDQADQIRKYRANASHPEVDMAIEEIVNEAIVVPDEENVVELNLDSVEMSDSLKKKVHVEFQHVLNMLTFNERAHDIFRSWYVDGRLYHHLIVDSTKTKEGIQEVRYIDALKVRKVKQVIKKRDLATGVDVVDKVEEYYIYNEKNGNDKKNANATVTAGTKTSAVRLSNDSVSYVTSGLLDETKSRVVSHLHKALRPINQLRMMEDSLIIYRLARAPERRIFYVDTGNMPKGKSEQYVNDLMTRYRNKLVYDQSTGELKDSRKHMSMLDDFWLPRREGGRGTEVTTLPGGTNLGEIDDVKYFQRKVYQALNVPVSRLEQESAYSLGRATEINREEIKFQKFITRLRQRFGKLFTHILRQQLILKGVITDADWKELFHNRVRVEFYKDNHYTELKDAEVLTQRLQLVDQAAQYVGEYLSKDWVMTNVFRFTKEEAEDMKKQIQTEIESGEVEVDAEDDEKEQG
jgi:hypothetical protein|tara:strand:+ start:2030 stop:3604 length:1575 start_codon:yes stop_codon:yes gene_type:complete